HDHHHEHSHTQPCDITAAIDALEVSDKVKRNAKAVYDIIAEAESIAHSVPVCEIHFHEVGNADAIADVISSCVLFDMLSVDRIIATPVCVGFGKVRCAHGIIPVPAPATANILKGIPVYAGKIEGELCTPTGAAIVKHFVNEFANMPVFSAQKIGYGTGTKDLDAANCVRAMTGSIDCVQSDTIVELSCNIDDMTPEMIGFASDVLLDAGARDVYTTPIGMKKSRPGIKFTVMCPEDETSKFVRLMFKHTTTLGIRECRMGRYILDRAVNEQESIYGTVHVKTSEGFGISRSKYEYDDIARIAKENELSMDEVLLDLKPDEDNQH
ncbi:MAG: nickel pincer cofactor biosynthesis protein LarC, partial [Lachnospiraceae bacterium]|nr:nickel pincer cofactor biosynthesis protein LarC [Lachnospiraceae bacterium]